MTTTKNIPADKTASPNRPNEVSTANAKGKPGGAQPAPGGAQPAPSGKKAIGVKEVPPFEWKLLGTASGYTLTLFKSVEREDSDAQLVRVRKDGYYKDLRVVDIDMKIVQPKRLRPAKKPATKAKVASKPAAKKSKVIRKDSGPTILKMVVGAKSKTTKTAKKTKKTKSTSSRPAKKSVKKAVKATTKKSSKAAVKKVKKTKTAAKKKTTKPAKPVKKKTRKKK